MNAAEFIPSDLYPTVINANECLVWEEGDKPYVVSVREVSESEAKALLAGDTADQEHRIPEQFPTAGEEIHDWVNEVLNAFGWEFMHTADEYDVWVKGDDDFSIHFSPFSAEFNWRDDVDHYGPTETFTNFDDFKRKVESL